MSSDRIGRRVRALLPWLTGAVAGLLIGAHAGSARAQDATLVTQAGAGVFSGNTSYQGVRLSSLRFGLGGAVDPGGSATGDVTCTLRGRTLGGLGPDREVVLEGVIATGSLSPTGVVSVGGSGQVDLGDGSPPLSGVTFDLTLTANSNLQGEIVLVLGGTSLNAAWMTEGSVARSACVATEVGSTLRFVSQSAFVWVAGPLPASFEVYRGAFQIGAFTFNDTCFDQPAATSSSDAGLPPVDRAFFYMVSARNACGEGPHGVVTAGSQIPNAAPCP
jgi:hypothetical protein